MIPNMTSSGETGYMKQELLSKIHHYIVNMNSQSDERISLQVVDLAEICELHSRWQDQLRDVKPHYGETSHLAFSDYAFKVSF
jgi:hypothetical protein